MYEVVNNEAMFKNATLNRGIKKESNLNFVLLFHKYEEHRVKNIHSSFHY